MDGVPLRSPSRLLSRRPSLSPSDSMKASSSPQQVLSHDADRDDVLVGGDRTRLGTTPTPTDSTPSAPPVRRGRGQRISEATDEAARLELIAEAKGRRQQRIKRSADRQRKQVAKKLRQRRERILREHVPEADPDDWESPAVRRILDRKLTDARERRLFSLPPRPEIQVGGFGRLI